MNEEYREPKPGRPSLPDGQACDCKVSINLKEHQEEFVKAQAKVRCIKTAEYLRNLVQDAYTQHAIREAQKERMKERGGKQPSPESPAQSLEHSIEELLAWLDAVSTKRDDVLSALKKWRGSQQAEGEQESNG